MASALKFPIPLWGIALASQIQALGVDSIFYSRFWLSVLALRMASVAWLQAPIRSPVWIWMIASPIRAPSNRGRKSS